MSVVFQPATRRCSWTKLLHTVSEAKELRESGVHYRLQYAKIMTSAHTASGFSSELQFFFSRNLYLNAPLYTMVRIGKWRLNHQIMMIVDPAKVVWVILRYLALNRGAAKGAKEGAKGDR